MEKNCTVCIKKLDVVNYLKHRTVFKTFNKKNRRKNNNNTSYHNQKSKLLITITMTIEPQPSSDEVLELVEFIKTGIRRSTRT